MGLIGSREEWRRWRSALWAAYGLAPRVVKLGVGIALLMVLRRLWRLRQKKHELQHHYTAMGEPDPSIHGHFVRNQQGLWLHHRCWKPQDLATPYGVVFLVHGFAEHCGRYEHVAKVFNDHGLVVYGFDHQGHGKSHGDTVHVERFEDYVDDAEVVLERVVQRDMRANGWDIPVFLLGHSMGGLVAVLLANRAPSRFCAVVLSAPALVPDPVTANPFMIFLAHALGWLLPKLSIDLGPRPPVSSDEQVQRQFIADPLVPHTTLRAGWASEIFHAMKRAMASAQDVHWPYLLLQGSRDKLVDPRGAVKFHEETKSRDKQLLVYPEMEHECFNEPERARVLGDVVRWVKLRM